MEGVHSEPLCREALEARREVRCDRHPETLVSINNLGSLLKDKGDLVAAEPLLHEAAEGCFEVLGDRHPDTLASINNLAGLLKAKGDLEGALRLFAEELEGLRLLHGAGRRRRRGWRRRSGASRAIKSNQEQSRAINRRGASRAQRAARESRRGVPAV